MQQEIQQATQQLPTLDASGFAWPSPAYLFGAIMFGLIGLAAFRYGKKTANPRPLMIGVAMLAYPYAISETWALYAIGCALCGLLYWLRERDRW